MGGRLLRSWVEQPLLDIDEINGRLDAVEELVRDRMLGMTLAEELEGVYDMERLMNKVAYRNINARDCLALCASLKRIPGIRELLKNASSEEMIRIRQELDPLEELTDLLDRAIHPDAPAVITEGGIIREGFSAILDEYRESQTADAFIEKTTLLARQKARVRVVTSDRPEQLIALGNEAMRTSAREFRREVIQVQGSIAEFIEKNNRPGTERSFERLYKEAWRESHQTCGRRTRKAASSSSVGM